MLLSSSSMIQANSMGKVYWVCALHNMATLCFGKMVIIPWIVSSQFYCLCSKHVAEMMLERRVLQIAIHNKIKACPSQKLNFWLFAKINVIWIFFKRGCWKEYFGFEFRALNTLLSAAIKSVFSHSLVLLITFPVTAVSRRLLYQQGLYRDCLNSTIS